MTRFVHWPPMGDRTMPTQTDREASTIAARAETLRLDLESLPRSTTTLELCRRFLSFLADAFPHCTIVLYRRADGDNQWTRVDHGTGAPSNGQPEYSPVEGQPDFRLVDDGSGLRGIQRLGDGGRVSIVIDHTRSGVPFADIDLLSLQLYATLLEAASRTLVTRQTEKALLFSLNHRVLQLTSLIDTGIEVSRLDPGMTPHQLALERAASLTNASRGVLIVDNGSATQEQYSFPHGTDMIPGEGTADQITSSFSFRTQTYTFRLFEKESRGSVRGFDETDQMLLDALVRQVHASLENRYLHAQSLEKQRIDQDIAVAASIQQRILPATLPVIEGYDVAGINLPSKSVGGDYYDCIPLPDGRYALVMADVSGKGVPAALLVSTLHAYLSAYLESPVSLADLARSLNRVIGRASTEDKFITAFLALLTPATGELLSVNAGHTPVYLQRCSGDIHELSVGGLPFGMLDLDMPYVVETTMLEPGDRLVLYTDGVTEAMNDAGDLYDSQRPFKEFVGHHRPTSSAEFIQELIGDVKSFIGSAQQSDDITAMYVVRQSGTVGI